MAWNAKSRTITFACDALPELVSRGHKGKEYREQLLTVRSIQGREAVGELFEYSVLAEVEDIDLLLNPANAAQIDLGKLLNKEGSVEIQVDGIGTFRPGQQGETGYANIGADIRYLSGNIREARILCREDRAPLYEFVLRPAVWRASQNQNSRIFRGVSVTEVLSELLRDYGLIEWRIGGPSNSSKRYYPARDFIRQAWESDWNFALRLMEEWGLFFWFEHQKRSHTLVISDSLSGFHPHGVAYETLRYHTGARIDEERHSRCLRVWRTPLRCSCKRRESRSLRRREKFASRRRAIACKSSRTKTATSSARTAGSI